MLKFKIYLLKHGISQNDLSRLLGISKASVSHKLKGRNNFSIYELNKMRLLFKMSDREFIEIFIEDVT